MFGYVRPRKDQLKICDYDRYKAAYCGLCRALGKKYGFLYRFFVNYDMTFLYFLLASVFPEAPKEKCLCPANVFCKKPCYCADDLFERVSGMNVIFCHYQLCDAVEDRGAVAALPYRLARFFTRRGYKKAAKRFSDFDKLASSQLAHLSDLEHARCTSIDATADAFASILRGCVADETRKEVRRPMEQVLYHVGRFLYLTDAMDDLQKDCKNNSYNPLRYRFEITDGVLNAQAAEDLKLTIEHSVSLAGAALELLPMKSGAEILSNIIYLGLPAVLQTVSDGNFRARAKI